MTTLLHIRREQVVALVGAMGEGVEERVGAHLRRVWPDETGAMSEDELARWVRYGVQKGRRYEIKAEYDVARLLDLMFVLGPQFEEDEALPWVAEILADPGLDGRQRVDALMGRAARADEDEDGGAAPDGEAP